MMKTKMLSIQKMVAMIIATLIMVLSVSSYQMNARAVNTSQSYKVYNAQTGVYLRQYTLSALESHTNSRAIVGDDTRYVDWSKSGVCKITTTISSGTCFVVDAHTIATAAHCVFNADLQTGSLITKIQLFDANGNPTLVATPVETHIPINYISYNTSSENYYSNDDYALITVKEDLSAYACFNLGVPTANIEEQNHEITVTGFSGDYNIDNDTNVSGIGGIYNLYTKKIYYTCDMYFGSSGGPVYLTESRCGYTYNTVIAINVAQPKSSAPQYNIGTRMTTDLIHFYKNNPNLNWE